MKLTGKEIAEIAFKDFENFFYYSSGFSIKKEFNSQGLHHASLIGAGENTRIKFSEDFCNFEAKTLTDLYFVLIILCHEIAHYTNKHNNYTDKDKIDFTGIETWADYFGARIFMCIITFGKKTKGAMSAFDKNWDQDVVLKAMGSALSDIYKLFINTSDARYPVPIERILTFNAGATSFFYRVYNELKPAWTIHVLTILLNESGLKDIAANHAPDWDKQAAISNRNSEIHKSIQSNNIAITKGLKPEFLSLLVTNYNLSEQEISRNKEKLQDEAKSIGLDLEKFINKNA